MNRRGATTARVLVSWLLLAGVTPGAHAHQTPLPIALWGGFAPDAVHCQRVVSQAAARCANFAWTLSGTCSAAQMAGEACDPLATRAAINHRHALELGVAERACVAVDLPTMGFASLVDVDVDVDIFCQELEDAMVSAIFRPAMQRGVIATTDAATRACITATADASTRLLRLAFRTRRHTFDRIAVVATGPQRKLALIKQSSLRVQRLQALIAQRLQAACPDFATRYGFPSGVFLRLVAQRADCLTGRTYVQDAVSCPMSVCGDGMRESGEYCDDGNLNDGDGCNETCNVE